MGHTLEAGPEDSASPVRTTAANAAASGIPRRWLRGCVRWPRRPLAADRSPGAEVKALLCGADGEASAAAFR